MQCLYPRSTATAPSDAKNTGSTVGKGPGGLDRDCDVRDGDQPQEQEAAPKTRGYFNGSAEEVRGPLDGLVERVAEDVGAAFRGDVLEALATLKASDRSGFESLLEQLDKTNKRLRVGDLRREVDRRAPVLRETEEGTPSKGRDGKPRLLVDMARRDEVVTAVAELLTPEPSLYVRGVVVQLGRDQLTDEPAARQLTSDMAVHIIHQRCAPYCYARTRQGDVVERDTEMPLRVGKTYLDLAGCGTLRPLNGITSAPLLSDEGSIACHDGYDATTGMLCVDVPDVASVVPESPSRADVEAALLTMRRAFATFPFADAETVIEDSVRKVDLSKPPGADESAFLVGLLTAVTRPSLPLAPGLLLTAAPFSGSGAGKGLLVRLMCRIAFGKEPAAITAGHDADELDKRLVSFLIEGAQVLFLDNVNATALKSDTLASCITERPARVRVLGSSRLVTLNASSVIAVTGNGLSVSEDLGRRFISIELDAGVEDPEARAFKGDIRAEVKRDRLPLLGAALTIWRWGRQQGEALPRGQPFGSFETWARWTRDPLLALHCADPVERVFAKKQDDHRRQHLADVFTTWWNKHGPRPVAGANLHADVLAFIDPQSRGRNWVTAWLTRNVGARVGGFHLTRQRANGQWGHSTYALERLAGDAQSGPRGNGHAPDHDPFGAPAAPESPQGLEVDI